MRLTLKQTSMTRVAATVAASLIFTFAAAQTFTRKVQQQHTGEGVVTIHHDASIDGIVNAASAGQHASAPAATTAKTATSETAKKQTPKNETAKAEKAKTKPHTDTAKTKPQTDTAKAKPQDDTAKAKPHTDTAKAKPQDDAAKAKPHTDTAKAKPQDDAAKAKPHTDTAKAKPLDDAAKAGGTTANGYAAATVRDSVATASTDTVSSVMRHGYKTTGYRVQAFAGGNTRKDRQKAERTGNNMRQLFPGEDVYVRFYSPRWVCRVGNYLSYEEAHEKLLLIRKMGYETATIVKGKIIVYDD